MLLLAMTEFVQEDILSDTSKFWRCYVPEKGDTDWIAHWGRIGTIGAIKYQESGNPMQKAKQKLQKGYVVSRTDTLRMGDREVKTLTAAELHNAVALLAVPKEQRVSRALEQLAEIEALLR